MTFSQLFDKWHEEKSKSIGEVTSRLYRSYFDKYIPNDLASRAVNDFDHDEWLEAENEMLSGKAPNGAKVPKTTARQALTAYHAAFRYGREKFGLYDPAEGEQISSKDMYSVTVFNRREINTMIKAVKPYDIFHLCIMLCLFTGVEVGEICAAQWKDIDTENKLIKIRRVLVSEDGKNKTFIVTEPKNKKVVRDLPIPTWIAEQLEIMKPMHNDEDFLLAGPGGNAHPANFRARYAAFLKTAGVEKRMITALRHTFAMTCIKKNVDIKTLSEMLGHSSTSVTTRMYYGKQSKNKRDIIEKLYE